MPRMLLGDEILDRQRLALVAPVLARLRVQVLGERLGQPIGQRLDHDRVVVVVRLLELPRELVGAEARRDRERAEVVRHAALARGDEIGQRQIRLVVGDRSPAAAASAKRVSSARPRVVLVDDDVVAVAVRRPEAVDAARREQLARRRCDRAAPARCRTARAPRRRTADDRGSPGSGPSAPTPRRRTSSRCTARASSSGTSADAPADETTASRSPDRPSRSAAGWRAPSRTSSSGFSRRVAYCWRSVSCASRLAALERRPRSSLEQARHDVDRARRVEHVHRRPAVLRRDLHRRVLPAGRRAADEQRQRECRAAPSPSRRTPSRRATA